MSENTRREPQLIGINNLSSKLEATFGLGKVKEQARCPAREQEESCTVHQASAHVDPSFFKNSQWSADGTTILTSGSDNVLRTFILPSDLLDPPVPHDIVPYSLHTLPEPSYASLIHPSYNLAEPSTCLFIATLKDLPMRLLTPFAPQILATYPLVSETTEAWIAPHSLTFSHNEPNTLFAGANGLIAEFDLHRSGEGPVTSTRTGRGRKRTGVQGLENDGMNGIVSAMAISTGGVLAAGTFTRRIGLYDGNGRGGTIATFDLGQQAEGEDDLTGLGITQVLWSPCGRYLCVAERGSNGIGVWDIRGASNRLAWLQGRKARTQQRLGVDMIGQELWAGGTDGVVRVWENVGMENGTVSPGWSFQAHGDPIGSTVLHATGSVLATCSGQRRLTLDFGCAKCGHQSPSQSPTSTSSEASTHEARLEPDSSLRIWAL